MKVYDVRLDDIERRLDIVENQTKILNEMAVSIATIKTNLKNLIAILAALGTIGGGSIAGLLHHLITR